MNEGAFYMIQIELFNNISFLVIICFSFLIFVFTASMNKKNTIFKAFGIAFFLPFCLCIVSFLFLNQISEGYTYWFAETCLSIIFLLLILIGGNENNYSIVNLIIFSVGIGLCILLQQIYTLPFNLLSNKIRVMISVAIIASNLILLKYKNLSDKSFLKANVFLIISIVLNLFNEQRFVLEAILIFRFITYLTFYTYFYKKTYREFISKIEEANKMKKSLNKAINRDVKKKLLHYEITKQKLLMKSKTDSLTKTYNKEAIFDIINDLIKRDKPFSIMMFDMDNFKKINDEYGHIVGDVCIKKLVDTARASIRKVDYLGRYGGDEFIIVFPSLQIKEARLIAQRLIKNVNNINNPEFTISIGISTYPQDGNTVKDLVSIADEGLYYSKKTGKNNASYINSI